MEMDSGDLAYKRHVAAALFQKNYENLFFGCKIFE